MRPGRPLKGGYTNETIGDGAVVVKTYAGPDAELRLDRERTLLTQLRGRLPVPPLRDADGATLSLGFVAGVNGQEMLDSGHAAAALEACGTLLRRIQGIGVEVLPGEPEAGKVLVHGDYGPNNVLIDPATFQVTAVLDWEFAHLGNAIEDIAWCEWIVRMHHPEHRRSLGHFFDAYAADVPPWPARQAAMVARCEEQQRFCHRWEPDGAGEKQWEERAAVTAGWSE